jgi:hypothetical protein
MKWVWTLCENLWGDVPDGLRSSEAGGNSNAYELEQVRKKLLGEWLADVSSHRIDRECKLVRFNKVSFISIFDEYYFTHRFEKK